MDIQPPQILEAERALLGALLLEPKAFERVTDIISAQDFRRPDHRLVFGTIARLFEQGQSPDRIIVLDTLEREGQLDAAGGSEFLGQLAAETPGPVNIEAYAERIREDAARRELDQIGVETSAAARSAEDVVPAIERTQARLARLYETAAAGSRSPWPEPANVFAEFSAPSLSADDVPACLGAYAGAFAKATGFDPSMTITSAIAVAGASLDDKFQIVADSSTERFQQARHWFLVVGRPGAGKTPAQRKMLAPLWELDGEVRRAWESETAAMPPDQKRPPRPRLIISDTTIEALSEVLRDNPRGVLIANDEFEGWLGSLDAYRRGAGSRDRGEWLRCFDGGPHTVERVQRGTVHVENWGTSILTATTPAALAKLARQLPEDGLMQRFVPIVARSRIESEHVDELDVLQQRYRETIRRLFTARPRVHAGCVPMSFAASSFFRNWEAENQIRQEAFGVVEPALEAHFAKYPTFMLRLALTFHAAMIVNEDVVEARDPAAFPVAESTLRMAAEFLKRASRHAVAIYLARDSSETHELSRETARAIIAMRSPTIARRELVQRVRMFRKADSDQQFATLRLLVDLGWLRPAEGGYQKAVPTRYEVNPRLAVKFAERAETERERRAVIREMLHETTGRTDDGR